MSDTSKNKYRCPLCHHEEDNPHGHPTCPQCAGDWEPVCGAAAVIDQIDSSPPSPQFGDDPIELSEQPLNDASTKPTHASSQSSGDIPNDAASSPADSLGITRPPFAVSVKKVQQPRDSSTVCLEIRIQNASAEHLGGLVWLADKHGNEGSPESFVLPARTLGSLAPDEAATVFPQLCAFNAIFSHVAVRLQPANSGIAFWQADLQLHRERDGSVTVEIDKSVRADTSLGGIDNGVINIYASDTSIDTWQPVGLRRRGPKDLAHPSDARPPSFLGLRRPLKIRNESSVIPAIESARLTLSRTLDCGRDAYVQLIAGRTIHIGRARSWDSAEHADDLPNDIVLRSLAADESDDYISRYHGRIHITNRDVRYENRSGGGTDIGGRSLAAKGESVNLSDNSIIQPGRTVADNPHKSLGLCVRRTSSTIATDSYVLLAQDAHLTSAMDPGLSGDTVTLNRTDVVGELEHYVVFPQSTLIGSSEALCGWHLADSSVQSVHASLLWFDGSFWIEPYSHHCEVRVNSDLIPKNRVRRLTASANVKIGDLQFLVLPKWRQHIIDCRCCTGHGMSVQPLK